MTNAKEKDERKYAVDEATKGKWAECDGGATYPAIMPNGEWGYMPSRETFKGILTGLYFDQGDPPWRWYEMIIMEDRPPSYPDEAVWCEEGFIYIMDEEMARKKDAQHGGHLPQS